MLRVVVTDANLLFSRIVRDYLLYADTEGMIDVRWDQEVLNEMARNLQSKRGFTGDQVERLVHHLMNQSYPYALVYPTPEDYAAFSSLEMPDPADRHVVATAVACDADIICTENLKDFPDPVIKCVGIELLSADQLLERLALENPLRMSNVHRRTVEALNNGTDGEVLDALYQAGCESTTRVMENVLAGKVHVREHLRSGCPVAGYWRSPPRGA